MAAFFTDPCPEFTPTPFVPTRCICTHFKEAHDAAAAKKAAEEAAAAKAKKEDKVVMPDSDSDSDAGGLFGSDSDSDDADAAALAAERVAKAKAAKEAKEKKEAAKKKAAPVGRSQIVLDVKVWEADTDLDALAVKIKSEVVMEGLTWCEVAEKVPLAFGIFKLQVMCNVVDDLVPSADMIVEPIEAFEDLVQSVDIFAFNKL